jgi:hypothetical protein
MENVTLPDGAHLAYDVYDFTPPWERYAGALTRNLSLGQHRLSSFRVYLRLLAAG